LIDKTQSKKLLQIIIAVVARPPRTCRLDYMYVNKSQLGRIMNR